MTDCEDYLGGLATVSGCCGCGASGGLRCYVSGKPVKVTSLTVARVLTPKITVLCDECHMKTRVQNRGTHKRCCKCHNTLPVAEFGRNRSTLDGLQHACNVCRTQEYQNRRAKLHPKQKCVVCEKEKTLPEFQVVNFIRRHICRSCVDAMAPKTRNVPLDRTKGRRMSKQYVRTAAAGTRCMHCETLGVDFYHPSRGNTGELLKATFDTMEEIDLRIAEMVALCGVCKTGIEREKIKTELFD